MTAPIILLLIQQKHLWVSYDWKQLVCLESRVCFVVVKAATFKKTSHRVRRKMWWRSTRWTIICVLVVLLIIGIVVLIILFSTHVLPVSGGGDSTTTTTTAVPSLRWRCVSFHSTNHCWCLQHVMLALTCCPVKLARFLLINVHVNDDNVLPVYRLATVWNRVHAFSETTEPSLTVWVGDGYVVITRAVSDCLSVCLSVCLSTLQLLNH